MGQVGRVIQHVRRSLGLSQAQLGERAGFPQSVIARLEGGADLRVSTLERVLDALSLALVFSPRVEQLIQDPPLGSKLAAARDFGVDLGQLFASYRRSPDDRLQDAEAHSRGLEELLR